MPSDRLRKHLGAITLDYLRHIDKVEAVRVGKLDLERVGAADAVGARMITSKFRPLEKAMADRLVKALVSDDTYFREDSKGTMTGVAYRLWTDRKECVEVSCCLKKGNVWIVVKDSDGTVVDKGDRRGFRDDPDSPMRAIAAAVFPDDTEVQEATRKKAPATPGNKKPAANPKSDPPASSGVHEPPITGANHLAVNTKQDPPVAGKKWPEYQYPVVPMPLVPWDEESEAVRVTTDGVAVPVGEWIVAGKQPQVRYCHFDTAGSVDRKLP